MKDNYFENLNDTIKEYFKILSPEVPSFLYKYINTPEMQRLGKIGCGCGTDYSRIFKNKFFYSNLDHSIGVALIIWNFTKNKKQTLAGLFHDIATPVFKHCIDFMNGDYEKQESTEELTTYIIENSKEIMELLKQDEIELKEVDNYHKYPIADNDIPKLSADRLEYTFSNGLYLADIWEIKRIKQIYDNIEIQINEDNIQELGFKNKEIADDFIDGASQIWPIWISNTDKLALQFIADIIKEMSKKGFITKKDLYSLSEQDVIQKIENCEDNKITRCFKLFRNSVEVKESDKPIINKYCRSIKVKKRYIIPLVRANTGFERINNISSFAQDKINTYLQIKTKKYAYFNFNF